MATRTIKRAKSGATALPVRKPIDHIDLDEDFSDVSGDPNGDFTLVGADGSVISPKGNAEHRFMFCDPNDAEFGPGHWKRQIPGWEDVFYDGTVGIKGVTFEMGARIEARGQVLMRCNRLLREKRERYESHKTAIQNRAMAKARQVDVDLSSEDADERAAVVRAHRAQGSNLGYQKEARE